MIKTKQLYYSDFTINIDHFNKTIYISFFAYDDEDAISKLITKIQERIGFITTNIRNIVLYNKKTEIRKFTNLEELKQENTKV